MKAPKRFYGGKPRRLLVPEKSIKQCPMDGVHHTRTEETCSPVCARMERDHMDLLARIGA